MFLGMHISLILQSKEILGYEFGLVRASELLWFCVSVLSSANSALSCGLPTCNLENHLDSVLPHFLM